MAWLRLDSDGKHCRVGGIFAERALIISKNKKCVVVKEKGHSLNKSGVRGMPDYVYVSTQYVVYLITKDGGGEGVWVEEISRWDARQK